MRVMFNEERNRVLKQRLKMSGIGLEIAPYFNPAIKKSEHKVYYTDYVSTQELRQKAGLNPSFVDCELPEIDFVWKPGRQLAECAPAGLELDYAVASHVLEHIANPIGWLNQVLELLKVGGQIALVLPDKRSTCDFYRRLTDVPDVVAAAVEGSSRPTTAQVLDFTMNSVLDNQPGGQRPYELKLPFERAERNYSDREALSLALFSHNENHYLDVHCTVWTAASFKQVISRCIAIGLLAAEVSDPIENEFEFIVFLTKVGDPPKLHRRDGEAELAQLKQAYAEAIAHQEILKAQIEQFEAPKGILGSAGWPQEVERLARDGAQQSL